MIPPHLIHRTLITWVPVIFILTISRQAPPRTPLHTHIHIHSTFDHTFLPRLPRTIALILRFYTPVYPRVSFHLILHQCTYTSFVVQTLTRHLTSLLLLSVFSFRRPWHRYRWTILSARRRWNANLYGIRQWTLNILFNDLWNIASHRTVQIICCSSTNAVPVGILAGALQRLSLPAL